MPDRRRHRGPHPEDERLFAPASHQALRSAVGDLSWLLGRGYAEPSSVKIVGDRYRLTSRQRIAVVRSACSDERLLARRSKCVAPEMLAGRDLAIDGYNLLITIESALAGGVVLQGRDEACRDLASIHGSYRTMQETLPALELIGRSLTALDVSAATWLLDSPVSNSARLRGRMLDLAGQHGWPWCVDLCRNPDQALIDGGRTVVTSDSVVLDGCREWTNLARTIIEGHVPDAWVVTLR